MKLKKVLLFLLIAGVVIGLAACGSDAEEDNTEEENTEENDASSDNAEEASNNGESGLEGTVTMAGSTSVQPLSEELAAAFMEQNPDARIEVSGGGSGAGVTAAQDNAADFGAASREIKEDETGIDEWVIAIDGIGIIVHPDNPVSDLALEDITSIFAGEITNWSEVGGDDADIVVISREDGSGTRGAFTDIVLGDAELVDSALIQNSTGAVAEGVANDPNAIGYVSVGAMDDTVKGLLVDGAEPTAESISAGDYPVSRPFNYVANEETELSEVAQAYLDFVLSDEGQQVVEDNGFISVN
ncbi:phosphate ABC transporter substrate-binding protein [Virgibacillus sp. YIM 98842]|jgi:phosphate transport system substrate-binding protein|uniref:phosphate ABC transporter substrate-binding protein n=1 Tax=Virgibacillus sp. YIM 98842 TaxID=2663533 RepID=UPI001F09B22C|nr:phosphate ABC transporter substrate-binding protein [Virgibacillus sp. YIM 98842]